MKKSDARKKNEKNEKNTKKTRNEKNGVLRKLKHIFPNTYQRIKKHTLTCQGGTGCYRFNYQPGS